MQQKTSLFPLSLTLFLWCSLAVQAADKATPPKTYDWAQNYSHNKVANYLVRNVMAAFKHPGRALDLGAGAGVETLAMLRKGWHVTAIDATPASAKWTMALARRKKQQKHLKTITCKFEAIDWTTLAPVDLIYAECSLYLCAPAAFPALWKNMCQCLRPGGILACNLRSESAGVNKVPMVLHTLEEVEHLLKDLEVLELTFHKVKLFTYANRKRNRGGFFTIVARKPIGQVQTSDEGG